MKTNEILTIIAQKVVALDSRYTLESKKAEKISPIVGITSIASTASSYSYKLRYVVNVQINDKDTRRLYDKTDEVISTLNKYPISDGELGFLGATFTTLTETQVADLTFAVEVSQLPQEIIDFLGKDSIGAIDVLVNENCQL